MKSIRVTGEAGLVAVTVLCMVSAAYAAENTVDSPPVAEIDLTDVVEPSFLGAGVQWSAYPWFDVSESDWQKVFRRVDYLKLPLARVMVDVTTFFAGLDDDGTPQYLFDCELMRRLYKLLDYCENRDVTVVLGQWGSVESAVKPDTGNWDIPLDSTMHARITADLIEHVVAVKGYSCTRWFNLFNEPNISNISWQRWRQAILNLHAELAERNLLDKIKLTGADSVAGFGGRHSLQWMNNALSDPEVLRSLDVFDEHYYILNREIVSGNVEKWLDTVTTEVRAKAPGKQYFLGEFGVVDDVWGSDHPDQQLHVREFWYGVSMADLAVQFMRGGASGFIAWDMDDSMHWYGDSGGPLEPAPDAYERRKIWGFWNITGTEHGIPQEEYIRPWFYAYSQISRAFPKGCQIVKTEATGVDSLRVAAARIPDGDSYHLSFAAVNNSDENRSVKIVVPGAGTDVTLGKFEYFDVDKDNRVDSWPEVVDSTGNDVFPGVTRTLTNVDLVSGLVVEMPAKSAVVLSTLAGGCSIAVPN